MATTVERWHYAVEAQTVKGGRTGPNPGCYGNVTVNELERPHIEAIIRQNTAEALASVLPLVAEQGARLVGITVKWPMNEYGDDSDGQATA